MNSRTIQILKASRLCKNMDESDIGQLLEDHHSEIRTFERGERVFNETDRPEKIWVLLSGSVLIAKDTLSGKRMILAQIEHEGELFGEVYAFINQSGYDMYAEALQKTTVLTLQDTIFSEEENEKSDIIRRLRNNMLEIFAGKAYYMNRKLRVLGSGSLREKIARFLVEQQDKQGNIRMNFTREEMADYLNVTRPSLSREVGSMVKQGILAIEGRRIAVIDQEALEQYL